jgi:DNA-binding MarR family transcriptional regulator
MVHLRESDFCPERSPGYLARRIHLLGGALLEPLYAAEGITGTQFSALALIGLDRARTSAAISRELGHDQGAMTRIIDQLVLRGLIERERDAEDRRVVNLSLTEAGYDVTHRCKLKVVELWNGWLADWSPAEVDQLLANLNRLKSRLESLSSSEETH